MHIAIGGPDDTGDDNEDTEKKVTILRMAIDAVKLARQHADEVEFYAEYAGRSDPAYLMEMIEAVIDAGAAVVNIPDTTGYTVPEQYGCLIRSIREGVPNIARATISVHCHDDLGMAVANTLAGVLNGARQVEGTINGIGERAGNAALEEVIMAIRRFAASGASFVSQSADCQSGRDCRARDARLS